MTPKQRKVVNVEVFSRLRDLLGPKRVSRSPLDQINYSRDSWPLGLLWTRAGEVPYRPDFIVWPETTEEISKLLSMCNDFGIPLVPYGAGSGVCGGTVPLEGGIICDLKRMSRVETLNEKSLLVTVQTGIIGEHLERYLAHKGYTMGHFPSSIYCSTLGGYLATRSAGQLSSKYGKIEDMVVSVQAVLPNGEVIHTRTAPRRATGPNFDQLLVGTEGTLGIITRATMRIWPEPDHREFAAYRFASIEDGANAMRKMIQLGITPAVMRLYDETDTALSMSAIGYEQDGGNLLILVFDGGPKRCALEADMAAEVCASEGGRDLGCEPAEHWWEHRYAISYKQSIIMSSEHAVLDTVEVATTWKNLMRLYTSMRAALSEHVTVLAHFSHAYREGCSIYFTAVGHADEKMPDRELYQTMWESALDACVAAGGAVSHHHGVGILKAKWMARQRGQWMDVFAGLKQRLDPNNILNPNKMGLS